MDFSSLQMEQTFYSKKKPNSWPQYIKNSPAIMQSIDNPSLILPNRDSSSDAHISRHSSVYNIMPPDVTLTSGSDFQSLKLIPSLDGHVMPSSFLLLDEEEVLQVSKGILPPYIFSVILLGVTSYFVVCIVMASDVSDNVVYVCGTASHI